MSKKLKNKAREATKNLGQPEKYWVGGVSVMCAKY